MESKPKGGKPSARRTTTEADLRKSALRQTPPKQTRSKIGVALKKVRGGRVAGGGGPGTMPAAHPTPAPQAAVPGEQRRPRTRSTGLRGVTNLAVLASVKRGLVKSFEPISYVARLRKV